MIGCGEQKKAEETPDPVPLRPQQKTEMHINFR
jgi:hypothetical protein